MALAGGILQRLTANPLASPEVLGVSGGASLGYAAVIFGVAAPTGAMLGLGTMAGGAAALALVAGFVSRRDMPAERILLAGVAVSALASAVLSAISRSGHEKALAMVTAAAAGPGSAADRMRVLVAEFVAWHARRHQVARIVQYELAALPQPDYDAVVALRRQTDAAVRSLIEEGVESGVFTTPDIRSASRLGGFDFGANARRIAAFEEEVKLLVELR